MKEQSLRQRLFSSLSFFIPTRPVFSARTSAVFLSIFFSLAPSLQAKDLSPAAAALAQDRLVEVCYGGNSADAKLAFSAVGEFPSATHYFIETGIVQHMCDSIFQINSDWVISYISFGPGARDEVKKRPLIAALEEKSLDLEEPKISLKSFLLANAGGAANALLEKNDSIVSRALASISGRGSTKEGIAVPALRPKRSGGVRKLPIEKAVITSAFDMADLELLFGPIVAVASGSVLDGDLFSAAWRSDRRSIVSTAIAVGEISTCLTARINERVNIQGAATDWGLSDPIPRLPSNRQIFEMAARSQHDYLLKLRGYLVDLARTVAKDHKEAEEIRTWIDSIAFGKFVGLNSPTGEACKKEQGQFDRWLAQHRMDEKLAKLTGADLAEASRTCDDSPFVKGLAALPQVSEEDLALLRQTDAKGPSRDENGQPLIITPEKPSDENIKKTKEKTLDEALRLGTKGVKALLISRFDDWTSGRYGFGSGPKPYQLSAGYEEDGDTLQRLAGRQLLLAREELTSLIHGAGSFIEGSLQSLRAIKEKNAKDKTAATTHESSGSSQNAQVKVPNEEDKKRIEEGKQLFLSDWTPPAEPCDSLLEGVLGITCVSKLDDQNDDGAKVIPSPERFISQTIDRLRQASESYATLYLVLAQADLSAGAFRNRVDAEYACGEFFKGLDEMALRRRRDSTEFALVIDSNDLALSLEALQRSQELFNLSIADRDFLQMFNFAQKSRRAAGLEDTKRTRNYLRAQESGQTKSK